MKILRSSLLCAVWLSCICSSAISADSNAYDPLFIEGLSASYQPSNTAHAIVCFSAAVSNACLPAQLCLAEIMDIRDQEDAALHLFLDCVSDAPDAEYAIRRLMDFYPNSRFTDAQIATLASSVSTLTDNYLRALCAYQLGVLFASKGDFDTSREYFASLGALTNWLITGGFDNAERTGLNKSFGPEKDISTAMVYDGKEWQVSWRPAAPLLDSGALLLEVIRPNDWITAYIRTGLLAPSSTNAVLHVSFPGAFRVWLNGSPAAEVTRYGEYSPFQYRIPLELSAGTNIIVCKLCAENNSFTFSAWLHDPRNRPLALETIQPLDGTIPSACLDSGSWPEPLESPGTALWIDRSRSTNDTFSQLMLARYFMVNNNFDKAVEAYEKLLVPDTIGAVDCVHLGNLYMKKDSASQSVGAFRNAIEKDPDAVLADALIASHYIDRNQFDIAEPILNDALAQHTNSLNIRIGLISLYQARNWNEDAFRLARETCSLLPDYSISHQVLAFAAETKDTMDLSEKAHRDALARDASNREVRYSLAQILRRQRRLDEYFSQSAILSATKPATPAPWFMDLEVLISERDMPGSIALCSQALSIFPDHSGFHKLMGDILYMNYERDAAIASYKNALHYEPNYLWLRRYLDFLLKRDLSFFDTYAWSQDDVTELIDAYRNRPAVYDEELTRLLLWQVLIQLHQDGSSRIMYHVIRQVLNPKGIRAASSVNYAGELLTAVTHKTDGSVLEATSMSNNRVEFPDVQVGDIIEYTFRSDNYGGSWLDNNYYSTFSFDLPQSDVINAQLDIALPTNITLQAYRSHDDIIASTSVFDSTIVMQWSITNLPMFRGEPNEPPYLDLAHCISLSTLSNWNDIAKWQRGMWSDVTRSDRTVAELAATVSQGSTSVLDSINHVFKFVTENIRYTQLYEKRIAGVKPHTIPDILANRCGDCKDMALLTGELLKALGIKAYVTLLRTEDNGDVLTNIPSPDVFNHAIVFLPDIGLNGMFIDPTFRNGVFDLLPQPCQNIHAFVITDDGYQFITTPLSPPQDNLSEIKLSGVIQEDGSCTGALSYSVYRLSAAMMRNALENVPQTRNIGSYFVSKIDPSGKLDEFSMRNRSPGPEPVIMDLTFDAPQFARRHNDSLLFQLPFRLEPERLHGGLETRRHPLKFKTLDDQSQEYYLTLPKGYSIQVPIPDQTIETPFGSFSFHSEVRDNSLYVLWQCVLTVQLVSVEEYPAFRDFMGKCAHITSQVLTLQPE